MWAYHGETVAEAEGSHLCSGNEPMRGKRTAEDRAGQEERGTSFPSALRSEANNGSRIATMSRVSGVPVYFFFGREYISVLDQNLKG